MTYGLCLLVALAAAGPDEAAGGIVLDRPMYEDPSITFPTPIDEMPPALKAMWIEALAGPEAELKMRAAETIARLRTRRPYDLTDAAPRLVQVLKERGAALPVRLAVARALIVIESRDSAPELFAQAGRGEVEMRQLVEPALAAWDFEPARAVWLKRLEDANTPHYALLLAARCLGQVRETAATARLRALAESAETALGVRLEAARALGAIESSGLEDLAEKLASDASGGGTLGRLVAASMLRSHRSERATNLLKNLAVDQEPTVAAIALQWLLDQDPALVVPFADRVIRSRDANVRRLGAQSLVAVPSDSAVALLGPLLDDPHPGVRVYVRDSLFQLAQRPELDAAVREAGVKELARDAWRGAEQASMLLGALDHEPAADRLVVLLEHPRPEVTIAAAWALRRLAVPATLAPMLAVAERRTARLKANQSGPGHDEQISQIFQAFGQMTYRPAEPLLRDYVPKNFSLGFESRPAAIWALGHLHVGTPDASLVAALQGRLKDTASLPPEIEPVRRMSAVTLGRMKAEEALPALRQYHAPKGAFESVGAACNWAITQITGETFPEPPVEHRSESGWFLEPI
jgi:HEAT repeat protein